MKVRREEKKTKAGVAMVAPPHLILGKWRNSGNTRQ